MELAIQQQGGNVETDERLLKLRAAMIDMEWMILKFETEGKTTSIKYNRHLCVERGR